MENADADNLIDAFLSGGTGGSGASGGSGELDDAARLGLAELLEKDPAVLRAFDEAVQTESLLHAAHADPAAEQRAMALLKSRLRTEPFATVERPTRPTRAMTSRPSLNRRFVDSQNVTRLPAPTPINAWTALAASIVVLFGFAFYFIYDPAPTNNKQTTQNSERKNCLYTVSSGTVLVDGKDVHDLIENEWLVVPSSGAVTLNAKDGSKLTLEPGTRALLRKRGATLLNGSGRFGIAAGPESFVVQTPLGKVNAASGEFEARLEAGGATAAPDLSKTLVLSVTLASGTAEVECAGKKTLLSEAGVTRRFSEDVERKTEALDRDDPRPHLKPPEMRATQAILDQEKKLELTPEQVKQLKEIIGKFVKVEQDPKVQELHAQVKAAREKQGPEAGRAFEDQIRARADEILESEGHPGDPMAVLTDSQRRIIGPTVREIMREKHGPMGPNGEDREFPPRRENDDRPHPPPPPPPRHGDGGNDRPPARYEPRPPGIGRRATALNKLSVFTFADSCSEFRMRRSLRERNATRK